MPGDGPAAELPALEVLDHVAVYNVDELAEPERLAFIQAAGFDVFESPASCWADLPGRLGVGPDRNVLGVWGQTRDKLDAAMARVPGEPVLVAELVHVCPTD